MLLCCLLEPGLGLEFAWFELPEHGLSHWLAQMQGKRLQVRGLPESFQQSKSKSGVRLYDNLGLVHVTRLGCGDGLILTENGTR